MELCKGCVFESVFLVKHITKENKLQLLFEEKLISFWKLIRLRNLLTTSHHMFLSNYTFLSASNLFLKYILSHSYCS